MAKILVVDDSPSICAASKEYLAPDGHSVVTVQNGEQAIAAVAQDKPDLVLLDVQLPDMSGFQVCQKLRESGHTFPILIMSASDAYSPWVHQLAQGFLFKPYTDTVLRAKVQALLRTKSEASDTPIQKAASWDSPLNLLHHLRSSIGSVSGLIDIFKNKRQEDKEFKDKFLMLIQQSAESSMAFVEEYVELLNPLQPALEDLQVDSWLNAVVASHPISKAPGIAVRWQIDAGSLPVVLGDRALLDRAAQAILANAAEAMTGGGTLTVGAYGDIHRQWAHIVFQDTGEGMDEYVAEHSMEPFFTVKKNKRGIGLSWAQKILRAHGGDLEVSSASIAGASVLLKLAAKNKK
jgi:DNA-binding response OmpR family regulator